MSYRTFSLIPEYNNNIFSERFDQIDKMFSTITGEKPISDIPSYNLIQMDENLYQLEINIPGYQDKDLDISVHNNKISIVGKKNIDLKQNNSEKKIKWLHHGIKNNNFSINFNLNYKIKVKKAELNLGLLKIEFEYSIPEEEKPKKITIQNQISNKEIINTSN